jgi:ribonuclease P protein component
VVDPAVVPPRVAFSVGRKVGTSVVRHRIQRRLRAALRLEAGPMNGLWLVGVRSRAVAGLPFAVLRDEVRALVAEGAA